MYVIYISYCITNVRWCMLFVYIVVLHVSVLYWRPTVYYCGIKYHPITIAGTGETERQQALLSCGVSLGSSNSKLLKWPDNVCIYYFAYYSENCINVKFSAWLGLPWSLYPFLLGIVVGGQSMTYELIDYFLSYDYTMPTSSLLSCLLFISFSFLSWECRDIAFFVFLWC